MVNLLDNHDVPRFVESIPKQLNGDAARKRYLLAMAALFTLPGIPQIYAGNEVGMFGGSDPENRRMMPSWAFTPQRNQKSESGFLEKPGVVYETVKELVSLRNRHVALRQGDYDEVWRQNGERNANVFGFVRHSPAETPDGRAAFAKKENTLVIFNNGTRSATVEKLNLRAHFEEGDTLKNVLEANELGGDQDKEWVVKEGGIQIQLKAESVVVLKVK